MDENPSTEPTPRRRRLSLYERLAAAAALIAIGCLLAPWYRLEFRARLDQTGIEAFDFGAAALVLTMVAVLALINFCRIGRPPAVPLREGALIMAGGLWSAIICAFLILNPPSVRVKGLETEYSIGFGLFLTLAAAVVLAACGLQIRAKERRLNPSRGAVQEAHIRAAASPSQSS